MFDRKQYNKCKNASREDLKLFSRKNRPGNEKIGFSANFDEKLAIEVCNYASEWLNIKEKLFSDPKM